MTPAVHLAFRFHVNFVHSYRGDTPDERGFGKDIRIIRGIVRALDEANARGIPVRGTWDLENHFSLATVMPRHCPDLVAAIRRRVRENGDEVEVMSWNNGLVSAHTAAEFDAAISRAVSHADGAGMRDLFGSFAPVVRPQEMMWTPAHLARYPRHGIDAISLYYSALPFNAFSTFVPPLPLEQRHNPLRLVHPDVPGEMVLLPAVNHGDVADHLSLRRWLRRLHRHQRGMREPRDLLLLVDADADDEFWAGYGWPLVSRLLAAAGGLARLVESVAGLPFLRFTTPGEYLRTHEPVGTITLRQDTADGSFDGYASWAEKWTNQALWTGIERARLAELHARRLLEELPADDAAAGEARGLLARSFEPRLLALSTTFFGLASPLVNVDRLATGADLVTSALGDAVKAREVAQAAWTSTRPPRAGRGPAADEVAFAVLDMRRGVPVDGADYPPKPSRVLLSLPLAIDARRAVDLASGCHLRRDDGRRVPCIVRRSFGGTDAFELLFIEENDGGQRHGYSLRPGADAANRGAGYADSIMATRDAAILFDSHGEVLGIRGPGCELAADPLLVTSVTWNGRRYAAQTWDTTERGSSPCGSFQWRRVRSAIALPGARADVEREYLLAAGLPYGYVRTRVTWPATPPHGCRDGLVGRLGRTWDARWHEVMPCEIRPLLGDRKAAFRAWKHDWMDTTTWYDLDYGSFSSNRELDSANNHLGAGWVAFGDRHRGILVGQESARWSSPAFCPVRTRRRDGGLALTLNPFGSYRGRQYAYPTRATGLGRAMTLLMGDQLAPLAPDYAGRTQDFTLLLAPFLGDRPPLAAARDAEAFAYPPLVVPATPLVAASPWDRWALDPHDARYAP